MPPRTMRCLDLSCLSSQDHYLNYSPTAGLYWLFCNHFTPLDYGRYLSPLDRDTEQFPPRPLAPSIHRTRSESWTGRLREDESVSMT